MSESPPTTKKLELRELAKIFLKIGTFSVGGPMGHTAMMQDECVRRRGWLTNQELFDLLGACQLIPGPNSVELAIHIGRRRAGFAGMFVAGACFIVPAAVITASLAHAYVKYGSLPQISGLFYGIKPAVIAIILQAMWFLTKTAAKTRFLTLLAAAAFFSNVLGLNEVWVLLGGGFISALLVGTASRRAKGMAGGLFAAAALVTGKAASAAGVAAAAPVGLWPLFAAFLKVGTLLFGSGYVLLAMLKTDLVDGLHWITETQLIDAVVVGQVTPGPISSVATFIGYLTSGAPGAFVATLGMYLPSFFFVSISGALIPKIRKSVIASAAMDGVNAASLGLMAAVTLALGRSSLIDLPTVVIMLVSLGALLRFNVNSIWLVLGGAAVGYLF